MPQPQEYIQGQGFEATIVRTNRKKTAVIKVEDGLVRIVVPRDLPTECVERLLSAKERWIKNKLSQDCEARPVIARQYVSGEILPYLGQDFRLEVQCGAFAPARLIEGCLVVTLPGGDRNTVMVKTAVVRWYKLQAGIELWHKTGRYAGIIGVEPASIGIKSYKARWGSCSARGRIDFNWKLVMAPGRIVDYVVVHELCHLKQHNHSARFWREVERVLPDYAECRKWLRLNAKCLEV